MRLQDVEEVAGGVVRLDLDELALADRLSALRLARPDGLLDAVPLEEGEGAVEGHALLRSQCPGHEVHRRRSAGSPLGDPYSKTLL